MPLYHHIFTVLLTLIWGVNFVVVKYMVADIPPLTLLTLRLGLVVLFLLPFLRQVPENFAKFYIIATLLTVCHFAFMILALAFGMDASVAAMLDQLRVPFAALASFIFFSERLTKTAVLGMIIAIFGTYFILGSPSFAGNFLSFWLVMGSTVAWAFYNVLAKKDGHLGIFPFIAWSSLIGMPQLAVLAGVFEHAQWQHISVTWHHGLLFLYMVFAVSIVGHGGWYYLVRRYQVNLLAPYTLLIPVFGVTASILLLGESLNWYMIIGGLLTIAGTAMVVLFAERRNNLGHA